MNSNDLAKAYNDAASQFTYFLIGAAGASIAYALTRLDGQPWSPRMALGLIAMALWVLSVSAGLLLITWGQKVLSSNHILLLLHEGQHEKQPKTDVELKIAVDRTEVAISRNGVTARRIQVSQGWSLYLGVLVFMAWRVIELFAPHGDARPWCFIPGFLS